MTQGTVTEGGFVWSGSLERTDIHSVYATLRGLRFSGFLDLSDAGSTARILFSAGEPLDIKGGNTSTIALWNRGMFRAEQTLCDLSGEPTHARELSGALEEVRPAALWSWMSEYRLSATVELVAPQGRVEVWFSSGRAERAELNGAPELGALARVSSWASGSFTARLRPIFSAEPVAVTLAESSGPVLGPREFDLSKSIPIDLKHRPPPLEPHERPLPSRVAIEPTPPPAPRAAPAAVPASASLQASQPQPASRTPTSMTPGETDELHPGGSSGRWLWVPPIVALLAAGVIGVLYFLHLPPFPPAHIEAPMIVAPTPVSPIQPPIAQPPVAASPASEMPESAAAPAPESAAAPAPASAVAPAPESAVAPAPESAVAPAPESATAPSPNQAKADRLIAKARRLLVEGHPRTALETIRRVEKIAPDYENLAVYRDQAQGKLGSAVIQFSGEGTVTVDGAPLVSPRKLKLPAGPHWIDLGAGPKELILRRGETRVLQVLPR